MTSLSSSTSLSGSAASPSASGQTPPDDPSTISSQAALYLYTFLVTILILFALSTAIVVRSIVLRRRHRAIVEEAIRNGTYIPPLRRRTGLGEKPVMHDVFVYYDHNSDSDDMSSDWWQRVLPVTAVTVTSPTSEGVSKSRSSSGSDGPFAAHPSPPVLTRRDTNRTSITYSDDHSSSKNQKRSETVYTSNSLLTNVTLLVAMPSPHPVVNPSVGGSATQLPGGPSRPNNLPHVELGITVASLERSGAKDLT
ncbi:hypothetical protein BDW22DRAFT_1432457 [Trametopsis cervina]|nr:hypothetical protein BDW22DRAFT_1432457 [Trametopsis cervina]